jgi:hypothetical protein
MCTNLKAVQGLAPSTFRNAGRLTANAKTNKININEMIF